MEEYSVHKNQDKVTEDYCNLDLYCRNRDWLGVVTGSLSQSNGRVGFPMDTRSNPQHETHCFGLVLVSRVVVWIKNPAFSKMGR